MGATPPPPPNLYTPQWKAFFDVHKRIYIYFYIYYTVWLFAVTHSPHKGVGSALMNMFGAYINVYIERTICRKSFLLLLLLYTVQMCIHCKKICYFPPPSGNQTHSGREYFNYSSPGRVWLGSSRLWTGKSLTFLQCTCECMDKLGEISNKLNERWKIKERLFQI